MRGVIILMAILLTINPAHGFTTQWNNSYTNDSSNVTWYLNNTPVLSEENVGGSSFTHNFTIEGDHSVKASSKPKNISWSIEVYAPLNITSYYNNASNSTEFEVGYGRSVMFYVNRTGTVLGEFWSVNGSIVSNESAILFSPEEQGHYNITYTVYGEDRNVTLSWRVKVYLEVTDALNTTLRFYKEPGRIVSLAPSTTEMLFAVQMSSSIVGVDDYSDYPPELLNMSIERVGGPYTGLSVEAIVNLTPDLVVATEINPLSTIDQLKSLNLTVLTIQSKTVDDILENMLLLGEIGNKRQNATEAVEALSERIEAVEAFSSSLEEERKPRLFYVVWYPELWTSGKNTYAHDLIGMAGGVNIAGDGEGWYIMAKEALIAKDPDVIVCSGMGGSGLTVCNEIANDSALKGLKAVRNSKLYVVPDPNIVERPGPRIVDGLEFFYDIVRSNLREVEEEEGGGGSYQEPSASPVFSEAVQDYEDVEEDILEELSDKLLYEVGERAAVAPLLLLNRFPRIRGVEKPAQSFEEDIYSYSAEVALFKYYNAREVVVARGDLEVDAYAAVSLAESRDSPVLLTRTSELPDEVLSAIQKIKPRKVIIVGGEEAVSKGVEERLRDIAGVERIGGETRVETSVDIAWKIAPEKVIITGFEPGIEAAVASHLYNAPIIYVSPERLEPVLSFLEAYRPKMLFIDVDDQVKERIIEGV